MRWALWILAALWPVAAVAANDKPLTGPVPAWVEPVMAPTNDSGYPDAPVRLLLLDSQVALNPDQQSSYTRVVARLQTPQGLAAGNVNFSWDPETASVTVHQVVIRRGAEIIDVLAGGQQFTVARREANLENAMLDGMLTATLQPEGLQVGDILEFSFTHTNRDPTLDTHVEGFGAAWNMSPAARASFRAEWPTTSAVRARFIGDLPTVKPVVSGDITTLAVSMDDVEPVPPTKGAPPRFQIGRMIELTDFRDWNALSRLMAPLYAKAAVIPADGPLRGEVDRIAAASPDPKLRAEAALALVQDRVRYVALMMGVGGLVPADAATTWSRRFGDCKGKTALLLALLAELGIAAEPVLVNVISGDGLDERLPMASLFNHVIVRASIGGKSYWLDGTRTGDSAIERLETPNYGWGLPVTAAGAALMKFEAQPLAAPSYVRNLTIDASGGILAPARATGEIRLIGDLAVGTNMALSLQTAAQRDIQLRELWKQQFTSVEAESFDVDFDKTTRTLRLGMSGRTTLDWNDGWLAIPASRLGYRADFERGPGSRQDLPYAVDFPLFSSETTTILLPPGNYTISEPERAKVAQTIAGVEYGRTVTVSPGKAVVVLSERSIAPEFSAAEAAEAQAELRALADKPIYLKAPPEQRASQADLDVLSSEEPDSGSAFFDRGTIMLNSGKLDEAAADFERAIALDPRHAAALASRGIVRFWRKDFAGAKADVEAAAAIDSDLIPVLHGRGLVAAQENRVRDAVAEFSRALAKDPDDIFALFRRADMWNRLDDYDKALADLDRAKTLDPANVGPYLGVAEIHARRNQLPLVAAEARALIRVQPDDPNALTAAARMFARAKADADAMAAIDRAVTLKPEAATYVSRAALRPAADRAGVSADIDAALKIDPRHRMALLWKADLMEKDGDQASAIAIYDGLIAGGPPDAPLLVQRGSLKLAGNDVAAAEKDFAAALDADDGAAILNSVCWAKGQAGKLLETALADCDAALQKAPGNPAYLDSRALIHFRRGDMDAALRDYDAALKAMPDLPAALQGRSVVRARKGDAKGSAADRARAEELSPGIAASYARWGMTS